MVKQRAKTDDAPRGGRARTAGEMIGAVGDMAFRKFGFVQSSVVSRWAEIVGPRYAKVSAPESIRFPTGKRSGGVLTLLVEGAHAPLIQHLGPLIIERVNRFFGYPAIARVAFRQGRLPVAEAKLRRPALRPVPKEIGEGLREIADPELRLCLENLAARLTDSNGPPTVAPAVELPVSKLRSE